jgi:hypothetical protein
MKYSVKLSKICQNLLDGKSVGTVRAVATHEVLDDEWYAVGSANCEEARPVSSRFLGSNCPVAMVIRTDKVTLTFAFWKMTEEEAASELLRRSACKKTPPVTGLKRDILYIKGQMEWMRELGIKHDLDLRAMLADNLDLASVPCQFRPQLGRILAFLD